MAFANVNDGVIHFARSGKAGAPTIVFVNSLGTDCRIWTEVADRLGKRWSIVVYDKRGHGLSDSPSGTVSIDTHTDDLAALADHAGLDRFALVGLSIGGIIAMNLALRSPERLAALVLADTAPKIGTVESWNARIDAITRDGLSPIADALVGRWFAPAFRDTHPADFAFWRNMLLRTSVTGYIASCAAVRDADLSLRIGAITTPTLGVAGDQDVSTPQDLVRDMVDRIPGARFELIAAAGHLPAIEQPAVLAGLIADHLVENGYV